MTQAQLHPEQTNKSPAEGITKAPPRRLELWTPILSHSITDFFSFITVALMPLLAVRLGMDNSQRAIMLAAGAAISGGIQPIVAWINDRFDTRITGTLGLALAAVAIGGLGYAQSFIQLLILFSIGIAGVGAFHPAAAAAVGQAAGKRRSAMLSVFFLFGMLGGILGNVLSPYYVNFMASLSGNEGEAATDAGLRALAWFIAPGLITAGILAWAIHKAPHRSAGAHEHHAALSSKERTQRWIAFWILYAGNSIRFITNQMLLYLTIEWSIRLVRRNAEAETLTIALGQQASEINGPLQAAMQVGMGFGALALGFYLPAKFEKTAFIGIPIIGMAAIAIIPFTDSLLPHGIWAPVIIAGLLTIVAGLGFGSLIPVALSLGQRLLPHRTSFASGMLLGGAWCTAIVGPLLAKAIHKGLDENLAAGFFVTAATLSIASLLAIALPGRLIRNISPH